MYIYKKRIPLWFVYSLFMKTIYYGKSFVLVSLFILILKKILISSLKYNAKFRLPRSMCNVNLNLRNTKSEKISIFVKKNRGRHFQLKSRYLKKIVSVFIKLPNTLKINKYSIYIYSSVFLLFYFY